MKDLSLLILLAVVGCNKMLEILLEDESDSDKSADSDLGTDGDSEDETESEADSEDSVDTDTGTEMDTDSAMFDSTWCWMAVSDGDGHIVVIELDMDSGDWFEQGTYGSDLGEFIRTGGIGRLGDEIVMVAQIDGLAWHWVKLDMVDYSVLVVDSIDGIESIGSDGERIVTNCEEPNGVSGYKFCFYDDFEALTSGEIAEVVSSSTSAPRLCATEDHVFTAACSTSQVKEHDIATGEIIFTISLEDWDGQIWGMSVVGDVLHLASGGFGDRIARFNRANGELIDQVFLTDLPYPVSPTGLWCESY